MNRTQENRILDNGLILSGVIVGLVVLTRLFWYDKEKGLFSWDSFRHYSRQYFVSFMGDFIMFGIFRFLIGMTVGAIGYHLVLSGFVLESIKNTTGT